MKYIIDVGHPAHVHYFRNMARDLSSKGHIVLFTARAKEVTLDLLEYYGLPYKIIGKPTKGYLGKVISLMVTTSKLLFISLRFKPDMLLNASPSAAFVSWLLGKVHISLEDTFNMEQVRLYLPFTNLVLTGDYPHRHLGKKEVQYPGYQELLYLHPNTYTPKDEVLINLNVGQNEKYAIVRFIAWNATHDTGHQGISNANKQKLVESLSKHLRVFVSTESDNPQEFEKYRLKIRPEQMHEALYHAHLFVGESATMASEAAILGTPSIFIHNTKLGYTSDQATYGLLYQFSESEDDQNKAISKAVEIAMDDTAKSRLAEPRRMMLRDKIDVNAFLIWLVENYPASLKKIRRQDFDYGIFRK